MGSGGWFNALFEENFKKGFDDIMDHVVNAMDGHHYCAIGGGNDSGDNKNDDDDIKVSFTRQRFDISKIALCIIDIISIYYYNYVHQESCMNS